MGLDGTTDRLANDGSLCRRPGRKTVTPETVAQEAARLRERLAFDLAEAGHLRSKQWRAAIEDVPRHEFVPEFFAKIDVEAGPTLWDPIDAQRSGPERWLKMAYADVSHVTQLDGHLAPSDVAAAVDGNPTSSSTMPSLVARMWEDLDVRDGDQVLEIGTGTGYSTALGCQRLGEQNITSVEVDAAVGARAAEALDRAGYHPHLIVGDGLAGVPDYAPYDRIIATCSLRHIPPAWLEQSKPGTVILVTLSGWLGGTGLAKVTVTGPGTAEGSILPGYVSFMPARAHMPEPAIIPDLEDDAAPRPTVLGPDTITTYGPAQMVAQLAIPEAQYLQLSPDDGMPEHLLVQPDDSYAAFTGEPGRWMVQQGGPQKLWDKVEAGIAAWTSAGKPTLDTFHISVTPADQRIRLDNNGFAWPIFTSTPG
jgi:methyltransferase of ATP-grasp peptide maturase system